MIWWIGPVDQPALIRDIVHPAHQAGYSSYEIDQQWLHTYWMELDKKRLSIRAQLHTHAGAAFHSKTDDEYAVVYTTGFLSIVLPRFALESTCFDSAYVAELMPNGAFEQVSLESRLDIDD
ncbi:MAG TPA: hypothetical protein VF160_07180 [Candidatus Dormibacteraeota bacterium]